MDADLVKLCESIFCEHVDKLYADNLVRRRYHEGRAYVEAPVVGGWYPLEQVEMTKPTACKALVAQAGFELEKPDWAPRLPTSAEAIDRMKREPRCRLKLVGHYASSRRNVNWGPHPGWEDYLAGLAALPPPPGVFDIVQGAALGKIRPRLLAGLDAETWCWESPGWRLLEKIKEQEAPAKLAREKSALPTPVETGLARVSR
jgi:hypothetical protein